MNYPPRDVTYRDRLISLNILPLEHRLELYDLTLLYKIKNNLINVIFSQYLTPATNTYPHATSILTTITKSFPVIKNYCDNPISHAKSSSGNIYHRTSKPPILYIYLQATTILSYYKAKLSS